MAKRFQFSLQTLLLAVVPVAVVALPVGYLVRRPIAPVPVAIIIFSDESILNNVTVTLYPVDKGPSVQAKSDWDSRTYFRLLPGTYRVTVSQQHRDPFFPCRTRYSKLETSGLIANVRKGVGQDIQFDVSIP